MKLIHPRFLAIGVAMLAAAGLAVALTPDVQNLDRGPKIDLETMIPNKLGEWEVDQSIAQILPPPDVQESLKKIYSQTLSRTYINAKGQRVMLSIAYGDGFDKQLDVHRPEFCYPAQGFEVGAFEDRGIESKFGKIPLRRLVARQGSRIEPISYWVTIGGKSVSSTLDRKIEKFKRGLTGQVDSGMLIRVSSIGPDAKAGYAVQDEFIRALVMGIPVERRKLVINTDPTGQGG